ncbi:hypothetical protein IHQ11_26665 [Priestia megaterium]|uniref:hypothetical protein n=1 Tax=Priestia megaterium TaxID=1404 RepID=UPI001B3A0FB9|nr:hypothetical protein [Priestia megaterium]MBQ4870035.1 hypothetical protein [Priestia megaterium]
MKYFVIEDDELSNHAEETIYVFEHTKRKNKYGDILSLEDFAAKCRFIEARNRHMYWYKGKNVAEATVHEFEKKIRSEQKVLKELSKEEFIEVRNQFSDIIKPITFPNEATKSAYAYEPEWNDKFFVMETGEIYFGIYWFTTA